MIGHSNSPFCPLCQELDTVKHILFYCYHLGNHFRDEIISTLYNNNLPLEPVNLSILINKFNNTDSNFISVISNHISHILYRRSY